MGVQVDKNNFNGFASHNFILLEQLKKYGLNPMDWTLDWSRSSIAHVSRDRKLELIRDIQICSKEGNGPIFIGGAYVNGEKEKKAAEWIELTTAHDFF